MFIMGSSMSRKMLPWWHHQMETFFPHYWPFVQGIHGFPVNSPHKGQWHRALMFSLIYVWINGWVNNREAGDLRCYHGHYDVIVMLWYEMRPGHKKRCQKTRKWLVCDSHEILYKMCFLVQYSMSSSTCYCLIKSYVPTTDFIKIIKNIPMWQRWPKYLAEQKAVWEGNVNVKLTYIISQEKAKSHSTMPR